MTGFSDVIGSWKIIAISAPRTRRSSLVASALHEIGALVARSRPPKRVFGERVSPMTVSAVTDLPLPDSPTTASDLAGLERERDPVDGLHDALVGRERHREVLYLEQGASVQPHPRVECRVHDVDDRAEHHDEERAEHRDREHRRDVELLHRLSGVLADALKSKTVSVRIAPPPSTAPKSSTKPGGNTAGIAADASRTLRNNSIAPGWPLEAI